MSFGERLSKERKKIKKTQSDMAKILGIARTTYASYEQGHRQPDFETLNTLADFFGVSTDFLLTGKSGGQLALDYDNHEQLIETPENVRFPLRLKKMMEHKGITPEEMASNLNLHVKDFTNWYLISPCASLPSKERLEIISSLVGASIEYLLGYTDKLNNISQDEKDIAKRMEQIKKDLTSEDGLMFNGEPMSEEAIESFLEAMEYAVRQTQRINKKYIPKKFRDNEEN